MQSENLLTSLEHLMRHHQPVQINAYQQRHTTPDNHTFVLEFSFGKPLVLAVCCHIPLDLDALKAQLTSIASHLVPFVTEEDLCLFLSKSNTNVFPYLKSHNQQETDYAGLAELYRNYRGLIQSQRFGF
ncbi:MAG: hypothetical protein Q8J69_07565 [Sphingobacteriaceae bacterium]|nr:hypothetical protein [Sphingobacteriaceae bacterium]